MNSPKALRRFDFDTVMLPVKARADKQSKNDYVPVLNVARERNMTVITVNAVVKDPWPDKKKPYNTWYQPFDAQKEIDEALWFSLRP